MSLSRKRPASEGGPYKVRACEKGLRGFKALSMRFKRPMQYVAAND